MIVSRRELVRLVSGIAALWPLSGRAQQHPLPVIGFLSARSPEDTPHLVEAFRRGLSEVGFVEGQNVTLEYRWALGQHSRLPELAADLVRKPVTILVSTGGDVAALAAKRATSIIPIAFIIGGDPVKLGLAASYNRPGANATRISILSLSLEPKRLEFLRELVPKALFGSRRTIFRHTARQVRGVGGPLCGANNVSLPRIYYGWRLDQLRGRFSRHLSSDWNLHRLNPQGREPGRIARPPADQVRAGYQFENRQGA
jgi:hypothetical protein